MTDSDQNQYNNDIRKWGNTTRKLMRARISALGIKGKTELLRKVRSPEAMASLQKRISAEGDLTKMLSANYRSQDGEIFRIGLKFPRQGVWVAKGVGRKHPVSSPRQAKDWFNAALDQRVPDLADLVIKYKADKTLNTVMAERLKIK